jgi:hypothetical protein
MSTYSPPTRGSRSLLILLLYSLFFICVPFIPGFPFKFSTLSSLAFDSSTSFDAVYDLYNSSSSSFTPLSSPDSPFCSSSLSISISVLSFSSPPFSSFSSLFTFPLFTRVTNKLKQQFASFLPLEFDYSYIPYYELPISVSSSSIFELNLTDLHTIYYDIDQFLVSAPLQVNSSLSSTYHFILLLNTDKESEWRIQATKKNDRVLSSESLISPVLPYYRLFSDESANQRGGNILIVNFKQEFEDLKHFERIIISSFLYGFRDYLSLSMKNNKENALFPEFSHKEVEALMNNSFNERFHLLIQRFQQIQTLKQLSNSFDYSIQEDERIQQAIQFTVKAYKGWKEGNLAVASEFSRDSLHLLNSVLSDPLYLISSYFPSEYYYAIFAPFFVPAFIPVFVTAIKRISEWKQRNKRKSNASNQQNVEKPKVE